MCWIHRTITATLATLALLTGLSKGEPPSRWPQFRGPDSLGTAEAADLPDRWSATENVAWTTDIPGRGWSSPIVWGDRVFLTTVVNLGASEEPKKGLYFGGNRPKPPESVHEWRVYCLDLATGRVLWERLAHRGVPSTAVHLKNSFASETPVTDGERVYAYFGNIGVFCFDPDGEPVWTKRLDPHPTRYGWGTAASPVLHDDRLIVLNDNEEDSYLLALDNRTGEELWRTERDEKSNWSTPYVWKNDARSEIVTAGTGKVRSYSRDGELLWSLQGMSSITIATPYARDGLLYLSSGYVQDPLRPIYAVRPGASGDISLQGDETSNEFIAWCDRTAAPYNPTTLVAGGRLYVLYDRGFVACHNARDGSLIYDRQRLLEGRAFTASPWATSDRVFCLNEYGVTYVLEAGDKFRLLHTNELAEDDMCMATPAIAGDRLLIRTSARVYCIRSDAASAAHRVVVQGDGRLAIVSGSGAIEWEMPWGGIHDIHVLPSGNLMVQDGPAKLAEIDVKTRAVVWSYDSAKSNGNEGKRVEVHAFQPLEHGRVMIAESGPARIIEVDHDGKLLRELKLRVNHPSTHSDTRLARKLKNGNYLVCHEADGFVREYDGRTGEVIWEYAVPLFGKEPKPGHGPEAFGNQVFAAVRLPSGNTLIATGNGHSILEVTPAKEIVWKIEQHDLPNITLAWVTTLEVLPNGHYVIGNCHAGPDNPLLIELDPRTKRVVWTFDQFAAFGNSVPNSQLLDAAGEALR